MGQFLTVLVLLIIMAVTYKVPDFIAQSKRAFDNKPRIEQSAAKLFDHITRKIKEDNVGGPVIQIEYPFFSNLGGFFNSRVEDLILTRTNGFRHEIAGADDIDSLSFTASWEPVQINDKYLSFVIRYDTYTGGKEEVLDMDTVNYDIRASKFVELKDLFATSTDYLKVLSSLAKSQILEKLASTSPDIIDDLASFKGAEPKAINFRNFAFNERSLFIYFMKYTVAPGSVGEVVVEIPLSKIR